MDRTSYQLFAACGAMFTLLILLAAVFGSGSFNAMQVIGGMGMFALTCYLALKGITTPASE